MSRSWLEQVQAWILIHGLHEFLHEWESKTMNIYEPIHQMIIFNAWCIWIHTWNDCHVFELYFGFLFLKVFKGICVHRYEFIVSVLNHEWSDFNHFTVLNLQHDTLDSILHRCFQGVRIPLHEFVVSGLNHESDFNHFKVWIHNTN